ncbi:MAG: radical SAM protein [Candidatus Aminicenantes bacterium]
MKILLIDPPFSRLMGFYRFFFPYGLGALSSYLKKDGHEVLIYDVDHGRTPVSMTSTDLLNVFHKYLEGVRDQDHPIWNEVEKVMRDFQPDVVGITFLSTKMGAVQNLTRMAKRIFPEVPVVLGGAHPTVLYESSLKKTGADYVVLGEGEETFAELARFLEKGGTRPEKIRGLAFRSGNGGIIRTPARPLIRDLDKMPFPDRESLYRKETYRPDDFSMIMTSRGCPYNCAFCSSIWERRVRYRSVRSIVEEIESLVNRFKTGNIYFKDDTFTLSRKRVLAFCDELEAKNLDINWECLTRIELVDEDIIQRMRRTGMNNLKIGIETGSQRLLNETNKNVTLEQIKRGAGVLNRLNQKWSAFFMLGYPDETEEEIELSRKLIQEIRPTYVSMSVLVPYPGCRYYYELKKKGLLGEDTDWNLYDPFSLYANANIRMSKPHFQQAVRETMRFVDQYNLRRAAQDQAHPSQSKGAT